jgi:type VI secretion system secreted protein Hcp
MASNITLKIDTVEGESVIDGHKKEIDILSWSWGMSQSGTMHVATGGGAGKVNVHDITFTKLVDAATPRLVQACCAGDHFKSAILSVRKAGGKAPVDYLVITMEDVIISSVTPGGSGGEDRISESATMNFAKFKLAYTGQDAAGNKSAAKNAGWNIAENKPHG